ncbi:helix-turn-helix domain-containing protein [Roseovarius aestuarii]|nr:helix-turn-helix transcriptional regulator [Roseovarius aestuarii]
MARAVDVYVGRRIRHLRWFNGITQKELADRIGIKFQQVQKYEIGSNRVSASKLWEISRVLNVPVAYFFEDLRQQDTEREDILKDYKATILIASYFKIPQEKRKAVLEFAKALADTKPNA